MEVCAAYQIPHSQFLSWSEDDRSKAIWQHIRTSNTCSQCGTRPEEWNPKLGGDVNAYMGDVRRCRGCEVLEREQAAVAKENLGRGIYVGLKPIEWPSQTRT